MSDPLREELDRLVDVALAEDVGDGDRTTDWTVPHGSAGVARIVARADGLVSGVGYDRVKQLSPATRRFHEIRRVVSNLGVFDVGTPDGSMRLVSVHPGVTVEQVVENTAFELAVPSAVPETRLPSDEELSLIRESIDPEGFANREVKA